MWAGAATVLGAGMLEAATVWGAGCTIILEWLVGVLTTHS